MTPKKLIFHKIQNTNQKGNCTNFSQLFGNVFFCRFAFPFSKNVPFNTYNLKTSIVYFILHLNMTFKLFLNIFLIFFEDFFSKTRFFTMLKIKQKYAFIVLRNIYILLEKLKKYVFFFFFSKYYLENSTFRNKKSNWKIKKKWFPCTIFFWIILIIIYIFVENN